MTLKMPSLHQLQRVITQWTRHLPEQLLLVHGSRLAMLVLAVGLLLSVWLLVQISYFEGTTVPLAEPERKLSTSAIDRLELWIEEVETERQTGLSLPPRPLFVVDDPLPEP